MRRTKAAIVLVAALTALVGCTTQGAPTPSPSADADELAVSKIKWEGGPQDPKLVMTTPLRVSQPTLGVIEPGTGASISMGQLVAFDSLVVDGETGAVEASTFTTGTPNQLILAQSTANSTMLTALTSSKVGARFLYVVPAPSNATPSSGSTPGTDGSLATTSKVIAVSVRSVTDLPTVAQGKARHPGSGLPIVTIGADGTPKLTAPKGNPSSTLTSGVLIEGSGPAVGDGQTIAAKYYGWLWDGTVFESVWGDQLPEVARLDEVISGWSRSLAGKKVGSRVLMVVPPAMAYGGAGRDMIPADATLIFLVDILGAY